jgi:CubicO group peptidase (beta-lactamase class C family)
MAPAAVTEAADNPRTSSARKNSSAIDPNLGARIQRVEQGLLRAVAINGETDAGLDLAARMRRFRVPGVSIAVISSGRASWARAYGVAEEGSSPRVNVETLFQAGSISKAVTAVGAMRLVERGTLSLDGDVNSRLKSWKVPQGPRAGSPPATLRTLLNHTAGLNVPSFGGYPPGAPVPTVLQILRGEPPANTPPVAVEGTFGEWSYSGGGTMVVQQLMTDATGQDFASLMQRLVLEPAKMGRSTFDHVSAERAGNAAAGHTANGPLPGRWRTYPELAAAGLWSTPSDLAQFGVALLRSLVPGGRKPLLSQASLREMLVPGQGAWGLGFFISGTGDSLVFGHDGSTSGFTSRILLRAATRDGVVVMTNGESEALINEIVRSVGREYGWPEERRPAKTVVAVDATRLAALTGDYRLDLVGRHVDFRVTVDGGRLMLASSAGTPAEILPMAESHFFNPDTGSEVLFVREATGATSEFKLIQSDGSQYAAKRIQ